MVHQPALHPSVQQFRDSGGSVHKYMGDNVVRMWVCFYVCCSDCVGFCGNVCCAAAVVKDSVFSLGVLKYIVCVYIGDVMDVVFSVCIVRRGAVCARVWGV